MLGKAIGSVAVQTEQRECRHSFLCRLWNFYFVIEMLFKEGCWISISFPIFKC